MTEDKNFKVTDKRGQEKQEAQSENVEENKEVATESEQDQAQDSAFPEANFTNFVASLGTSCMMHLGLLENPNTQQKETSLEMAQHEIDLLSMLEVKTKGNLDDQEKNFLSQLIYELRMHFVKASKQA